MGVLFFVFSCALLLWLVWGRMDPVTAKNMKFFAKFIMAMLTGLSVLGMLLGVLHQP
jgi:hypothetical protein